MIHRRATPSPPAPAPGIAGGSRIDGGSMPVIRIDRLVPDDRGEVVLFDDSHIGTVVVESDRPVLERGRVRRHRTDGGDDVSGWNFVRFADGPTLYYPPHLTLTVVEPEGDRRA